MVCMKLQLIIACLLAIYKGVECDYKQEVDAFFATYFPGDNECKSEAYGYGNQYTGNTTGAVAMVNLYTQECNIYEGENGKAFFKELNAQLRNAKGSLAKGDIWGDAAYLLSTALSMLSKNQVGNLYRGCKCPIPEPGDTFSFTSFASTSTDPATADTFVGYTSPHGSFFSMDSMSGKGASISVYSSIADEAEVLLDKLFRFEVTRVVKDATKAFNEVKKIHPQASNKPEAFIEMRPLSGRRRRSTGKLVLCRCGDPNNINTSAGTMLHIDALVAIVFVVWVWPF